MSDMETIATTMATDFVGAVKAAQRAKQAQVDDILARMDEAETARAVGLSEVRRMQEDAARLASDSLRAAEKVEAKYRDDMRAIGASLNEMRGPTMLPGRAAPAIEGNG